MQLANVATVPRSEKILRRANCAPDVAIGDCVRISGPGVGRWWTVAHASPTGVPFAPAVGIVIRKFSATLCLVQAEGPMRGIYTGLTPGASYYLGVDSRLTPILPLPPVHAQIMGVALGTDELLVHWYDETTTATDFGIDRVLVLRWDPAELPTHEEPCVCVCRSNGNLMMTRP